MSSTVISSRTLAHVHPNDQSADGRVAMALMITPAV
jgi:hypothetical protein